MKETYRNIIILVFAVILGMVLNDVQKYNYISDVGLIISFFGILATFVVISNYAQAKEAKDKVDGMESSITKIKNDIYDDKEQPVFKKEKAEVDEEIKEVATKLIQENNQRYNNIVNLLLEGLVPVQYAKLVKTIVEENNIYNCRVINPTTGREIKATAQLNEENKVVFKNRNHEIIENIEMVNGSKIDLPKIQQVVDLWKSINKTTREEKEAMNQIFEQPDNA